MRETVLLIQPPPVHHCRSLFVENNSLPPLGLLYVATVLQVYGLRVRVVDLTVEPMGPDDFRRLLATEQPGVAGIGVYAENFRFSRELSQLVKETVPDCTVVLGGPFPTFAYQEVLQDRNVDYLVRFEGEETIQELIDRLPDGGPTPERDVAGVAYRVNGRIHTSPQRPPIRDLDALPLPDRDLVPMELYRGLRGDPWAFTIITARGCPGRCTFCSAGAYWTGIRFRRVEKIIEEILSLNGRYAATGFYIADDTFNIRAIRVIQFCEMLRSCGVSFTWSCALRADRVSDAMFAAMYDCGCRRVHFGVESGVQAILDSVKKGVTLDQIEDAIAKADGAGLNVIITVILGHPQDTLATMRRTVSFVEEMQKRHRVCAMISVNTPFPGTYQHEHAEELGLKIHSRNWDDYTQYHPIVSTDNFTLDQLQRMYTESVTGRIAQANSRFMSEVTYGI